jgi:diguanylate cyclase (GGDEF)-like protein
MSFAGIRQLLSQLSIRKKLIFINLLVTTVALFVAVVMAIYGEYENRRDSIIESLLVQAKMVSNNTTAALIFDDPKGAADVLQAFSESEDIQSAIIFDEKGEALARYIKQGAKVNSTTGNGSNAYDNAINTRQLTEKMDFILDKNINIIHDIDFEGKTIGKLLMQADISYLYADIIDYLIFTSLMALIGLTLASVLLLKLSQSITRPLQQLTRLMESVTQNNDYSIRIDNISSDEIGVLTRGFNKMLSHIQVNDEKLAHELTERYKAEKHLDKLAYYDVITGIPNRHSFQQKLEQAIEAALKTNKLMALLFLDLDNFKTVNDTLGHKTGDLLLKQASSRLSNVVRQSDYICRIGGDEFAIIIEHINDIEDVSTVTKKCIECLSNPFVFDGKNFFIGVSIGLSVCPDDAVTANDLLVNADMAMYEAKLNGKNNYQYFNKEMNVVHNNKYQLESDLRHAIELGQLELYYQPQVDMRSGELSGVEALMRWNHPERGMVAPDEFIPRMVTPYCLSSCQKN